MERGRAHSRQGQRGYVDEQVIVEQQVFGLEPLAERIGVKRRQHMSRIRNKPLHPGLSLLVPSFAEIRIELDYGFDVKLVQEQTALGLILVETFQA